MKFRTRFLLLLAAGAAVLTGCRHEEADYDLPSIKIAGQFSVDSETKKASVAADKDLTVLNMTVTATRDWKAEIEWDADEVPWIAVTPEQGLASDGPQTVKVTILDNAGYNRAKQIKFSINYDYKTLSITQTGEKGEEIVGTLENPFTVSGVNKYVRNLGGDVQSPTPVYVKGKISQITGYYAESGTYGNATFYISDDGSTNNEFYAYRILYLGNKKFTAGQTDIKVGDEVIVCGNVVNYKGNTPETVQGTAFLYELNGVSNGGEVTPPVPAGDPTGTGTLTDPYNVAAALNAVKDLTWTSNDTYDKTGTVYVKGKISKIVDNGTFGQSGTFGNATFYISDDGSTNNELYCYRILYLGNKKYTSGTDVKVGDEVIICGELMNYRGNTPETVANSAYLYSLNGDTGGGVTPPGPGGEATGTGTQDDPYNVAAARNAVKDFTWTSNDTYDKTGTVYVKGKICKIADNGTFAQSGTFGNATFYISDDGKEGNELYCYRILYLGNVKYTSGTDIKVGDDVVICGELMNYRGNTPETVANKAYLYSLNESGGGGGGTSEVKAVTVAEFIAAPESDSQVYELVGTIGGSINTTYGNFDLTDASGTVYVYGLTATELGYGAKNDKSYGSLGLNEGDKIKLRGYRGSFGDKIEVVYAWFIEKVGGDTPPGPSGENGSGTLADPYTPAGAINAVKDLTWTSNTVYDKTDKVYVKGKISRIANNGTYVGGGTYGNASYWISADGTENEEFQIYRSLYFNGEKYTSGTDIKVGDEVIVYGALMNYKGNTPETVANENWLYSLNGKTDGGGGTTPSGNGSGTLSDPYTPAGAIDAVKDLTWTSNTVYDKTDKVYVKGKISRIANNGTYVGGGTYGNASYWISADGTENEEFQIFRSLYFNGEKYTSGTDIKVGDEVIVYGALMNYKGNTPETVANENWLYSLNGKTDGGSGGGGGGETGSSVSFETNASAQTWAQETDGTYGTGFSSTTQGVKVGYYKHTGTSNPVTPNNNEVRLYKNSAFVVTAPSGKKIKKMVITSPSTDSGKYCVDMTGLEGGSNGVADTSALTITWTGSASKVVLHANAGQVRMTALALEFE